MTAMVYLTHFRGGHLATSGSNAARRYLGWKPDGRLDERLTQHQRGTGAKITAAAVQRGLSLHVVATLPGDRQRERRLKRAGHFAERLCPECRSHHAASDGHAA